MSNSWALNLLCIISAAFFLCASGFLWHTTPQEGHFDLDSGTYDRIAWNFVQQGKLVDPAHPNNPPIQPVGYPFLLGVTYGIFDIQNPNVMIWMQVFFALACCGLLLLLGTLLWSISIGLLAFIFTA